MSKKKTAQYGNVEISAEDFKDENVRIQISMKVPMDLLKAYRAEALKKGKGYQTLMQEVLRSALPLASRPELTVFELEQIREGLKKIDSVKKRVDSIEEELPKLRRA